MSKPQKGDTVVATKDFGGYARPKIPKGTQGVVTKSGWGELEVLFTIQKMLGGTEQHKVAVSVEEIA